ncbi:AMP-binding protein [Bradyrhizobium sp. CB82]|uniref:AMP-binding protein n=1 Tax=Bradyrhizobium sp. CB82 TaxID=3039159 RepID=UPI0024B26367|nr:AMP-binding protein [Bradyrhizobium sp. CB82]WFU41521.1 AMP-binding protein [Bradyrhizobium sp. CB82]
MSNDRDLLTDADKENWTLNWALRERVRLSPNDTFLEVIGGETESFAQTFRAAQRLARGLSSIGVKPHDSVVVMAPNSAEAIHAWIAINMLGAIEVTINTAYRGQTLIHAVNTCAAKVIVIHESHLPALAEAQSKIPLLRCAIVIGGAARPIGELKVVALDSMHEAEATEPPDIMPAPSDIASIIYTSGTSGPAKGVRLCHAQNFLTAKSTVEHLRLTSRDVYYCVHPMFHMAGKFLAVYAQLLAGGKLVLDARFSAESWLEKVVRYGVTVTVAHGPMLEMIFAQPRTEVDARNDLKTVLCNPLPKRIAAEFEARFGVRAVEAYGMTEIGVPVWTAYDEPLRIGAAGKVDARWFDLQIADPVTDEPLPAMEIGQIVVRPKSAWTIMQGYLGMPEKTVEAWRNLWFQTGDAGYIDREGYLYFADRMGDRIRRRSENVASYDIEAAALLFPAVSECAAVGVPSEFEADDDIKLFVVPHRETNIDFGELSRHLATELPHYMVPRYLEAVDALPRTPTNKVKKSELRDRGINGNTWDRKSAGVSVRELVSREYPIR